MKKSHEQLLFFNFSVQTIRTDNSIITDDYCNSVTVVNIGTTAAQFNGIPIAAPVAPGLLGESISIPGNKGEIYSGRIDISFPGAGNGVVLVIQKKYVTALTKAPRIELAYE